MKIVTYPDERLRKKAVDVLPEEIGSEELDELINGMILTMAELDGLGLSACQVGSDKNLFVCHLDKEKEIVVAINPIMLAKSGKYWSRKEGCLSLPGERRTIRRSKMAKISFLDRNGAEHVLKKTKLEATIFQHEMDHLKGKLIIDY